MDSSGFEPEAPSLQGRCSTRLSYEPRLNIAYELLSCNDSFNLHTNQTFQKSLIKTCDQKSIFDQG